MRKLTVALLLSLGLSSTLASPPVRAETLEGQVVNETRRPIPGLTVFLVHPSMGRSVPKFTDEFGRFAFANVPLAFDAYYLEIYWGTVLLYRDDLPVRGDVQLLPIVLD